MPQNVLSKKEPINANNENESTATVACICTKIFAISRKSDIINYSLPNANKNEINIDTHKNKEKNKLLIKKNKI